MAGQGAARQGQAVGVGHGWVGRGLVRLGWAVEARQG
jgi:hypothetical protein